MPIPTHVPGGVLLASALLAATATTTSTATAQSPWAQESGGGFVQLAAYSIQYDKLFRSSGSDFRTSREIRDVTAELYGEYGVGEDWTLIGRVPLKFLDAGDPVPESTLPLTIQQGSFTAFGNVEFGVRHQFVQTEGGFVVAAQFDVELPTSDFDEATGLRSGYDAFTFFFDENRGLFFERRRVQILPGQRTLRLRPPAGRRVPESP